MDANLRQFKACVEAAAHSLKLPYSALIRERGISDFFVDAATKPWSARELAAHALVQLCQGSKDRPDFAICLAAVKFLTNSFSGPANKAEEERCLRDLVAILDNKGGESEFLDWSRAWFS